MPVEDAELLDLLAAAIAPARSEPPPEGFRALHHTLYECRAGRAGRAGRVRPWWYRRWLAGAGVGAFVLAGSGVAVAAGAPLPSPVRALASDIGLPVASPSVYSLQQDERRLSQLLQQPRPDPTPTAEAVAALHDQLGRLGPGDLRQAGSEPFRLLEQARRVLEGELEDAASGSCVRSGAARVAGPDGPASGTQQYSASPCVLGPGAVPTPEPSGKTDGESRSGQPHGNSDPLGGSGGSGAGGYEGTGTGGPVRPARSPRGSSGAGSAANPEGGSDASQGTGGSTSPVRMDQGSTSGPTDHAGGGGGQEDSGGGPGASGSPGEPGGRQGRSGPGDTEPQSQGEVSHTPGSGAGPAAEAGAGRGAP